MKTIGLTLIILILSSCSYLEDKDELLKKDLWILESMDFGNLEDYGNSTTRYFYESEKKIILEFNVLSWQWIKKGKVIDIANGPLTGEFTVPKLTNDYLSLFRLDFDTKEKYFYTFRHPGYKDWVSDEFIKSANAEK